jgi:hypothetical protein
MSSVAIVTVANARHVRSAEVTSAETSDATSAEAAHVTAATATHVTTAATTSVSAAAASATACLRTRRQQRRCKHGGCQYLHRSSYHNIFLSTDRVISDR